MNLEELFIKLGYTKEELLRKYNYNDNQNNLLKR